MGKLIVAKGLKKLSKVQKSHNLVTLTKITEMKMVNIAINKTIEMNSKTAIATILLKLLLNTDNLMGERTSIFEKSTKLILAKFDLKRTF